MKITNEQTEILNSIEKYKKIKINAFAGTGKTTTLNLIANHYKNKRILYIAFNSAVKNEASRLFPSNVFIKTTHGLAYLAIKNNTKIDLNKLKNYRVADIADIYSLDYSKALSALKIFESFCNNTQETISESDIEHKTAKKMFDHMLLGKLAPTHGFYLKYYYILLKNEQIRSYSYDLILLDEAQDTNSVTLGIFESLNSKTKLLVGDIHQQIYSFRGSRNILDKIDVNKTLYLSTSFRFNNSIAKYANNLLANFKNETIQIKTQKNEEENSLNKESKLPTKAFISRTNGLLIDEIARKIDKKEPFVTVRDPEEIFALTCEVHYFLLNQNKKIKINNFLKKFSTIEELDDYAKEVDDFELKSGIKIAKEYKKEIFEFKDIAKKFYKAWENRYKNGFVKRVEEITFLSTAHTSKGLEWESVEIADDFADFAELLLKLGFKDFKSFKKSYKKISSNDLLDEFNLFYVAITRAKQNIKKTSFNFNYLENSNFSYLDKRIKLFDK